MTTVAVVGATGQVGRVIRALLEERDFPADKVRFFASARSAGTTLPFRGEVVVVEVTAAATEEELEGIDVALVSAGGTMTTERAPRCGCAAAARGDNCSA